MVLFYNLNNLQGSQTGMCQRFKSILFYNLNNLQGSQTLLDANVLGKAFYNLNNLQGSQTSNGYHRTHILGSIVIINITILQLNTYLCL